MQVLQYLAGAAVGAGGGGGLQRSITVGTWDAGTALSDPSLLRRTSTQAGGVPRHANPYTCASLYCTIGVLEISTT
jgi:hypothetical protein